MRPLSILLPCCLQTTRIADSEMVDPIKLVELALSITTPANVIVDAALIASQSLIEEGTTAMSSNKELLLIASDRPEKSKGLLSSSLTSPSRAARRKWRSVGDQR